MQSIVVEQRWAGCLSRTESLQEFGGDLERGSPQANKLQSMVFGSSYSGCRIFALVVLVSMARTSGAWSASRYVARGGSDESACSASTRCASLSRAADELVPGDTLCVLHSGTAEAWLGKLFHAGSRQSDRYQGLITRTGDGRRYRRGFIRLATTWGTTLTPHFESAAIPNLADALTEQTGIAASVGRHTFIGSPQFLHSPFVFITAAEAFDLTASQTRALGKYMHDGGFVFADNAVPVFEFSQAEAALRCMFERALGARGRNHDDVCDPSECDHTQRDHAGDHLGLRAQELVTPPLQMEDGYATVPDTPGLGVELDEDALDSCRI